eukprot:CAMPEP_0184323378 /NCGR_PEP_ID=MMETSP1049-20130417/130002_1 /TAXON_ID=77928 /ORGANISM="Proteomonas sulcata, Strain CCMP704" /LENGTH=125 /DNA_ID=CAMNT_0026644857 /DNA_START=664 /DNA_END=1037 /DNA_ORIENTATION=+
MGIWVFEWAWVFGEVSLVNWWYELDNSKNANLVARTIGWSWRILLLLNIMLRIWGKKYLTVKELSQTDNEKVARHHIKEAQAQGIDLGSLIGHKLKHWIRRDLALLTGALLLLLFALVTLTQPNR